MELLCETCGTNAVESDAYANRLECDQKWNVQYALSNVLHYVKNAKKSGATKEMLIELVNKEYN